MGSGAVRQGPKPAAQAGFGDLAGGFEGGFAEEQVAQDRFFLDPLDNGDGGLEESGDSEGFDESFDIF